MGSSVTSARSTAAEVPAGASRDGRQQHLGTRAAAEPVLPGGAARLGLELVIGGVLAIAVSALTQAVVNRVPVPLPSHVPTALATFGVVVVTAAVVLAVTARRLPRATRALGVVGISGLATALLALPLKGTSFYLGGNSGDQTFRMQFLGRLADDWRLADLNYADLPPFYPSGWFWLAGRYADLTGTPAWEAFKPAGITTAAVVPCLALLVWWRLAGPRRALLIALATTAVGVHPALAGPFVDEPYSWCVAALLPAAVVLAWRAFGAVPARERTGAALALGVFLGLAAMTYTLYAGFGALLVTAACAAGVLRARAAEGTGAALRTRVPALVLAGVVSAALALLVWAPFVVAKLRGASGTAAAQHFLPQISTQLPAPMVAPTPWGALLLLGCAWLVLRARRDGTAAALLLVVVAAYAWYLLQTFVLAAGTTLLAFRMEAVLVQTTAVAGCLAAAALWRALPALARRAGGPVAGYLRELRLLAALALGAVFVVALQSAPQSLAHPVEAAHDAYGAGGRTAAGERDPEQGGAWIPDVLRAVEDVTQRPASELVVFSSLYELATFAPYTGYQQMTAHYANPLSRFDERRAEIESWAQASGPDDLVRRLDSGPFRAPDVFVLHRTPEGYQAGVTHDLFPREPNVGWTTVTFDPELFSPEHFEVREVGPFAVLARRS
ncbi:galactan 5-O-arabinofuranosyltransferase [Kineococcus xinjiangensis]|uniref:Galactan 5-O-arabinofuranosyltransferase n=1 Tax=Kineococcus xinjiangensis TaxID=512762 RepID=A0A2S6IU73_9ACTN|nr:arabinofuranosyltransferase [Kineococcus xinjiangensis]PPK97768.1 galactan 5-O-arabinofuranosyltransferase [Kineococcus xinjiangensis]